jgi:Putative Flp pilus-assembly TadE/G-like
MWRLIRRDRRERGAVAVVVAICMVVVMGFTALAVDVGSIYSDRQQLQNGADAAALAIAQSCVRGTCSDSANNTAADKYAKANKLDGQATGTVVKIDRTAGKVTVEARTPDLHPHQNWFAGVLGMPTTAIRAYASAKWGYPSGGPTVPLTFSWCVFIDATGGWDPTTGNALSSATVQVYLKEQKPPPKSCKPSDAITVPGGFSWVDTASTSTDCIVNVVAEQWLTSATGYDLPAACKDKDWTTVQNQTVFLPIFDATNGLTGANAKYRVKGLAAFTITGYCFSQSVQWQWEDQKCPANNKGIVGKFINYTDLSGALTLDPTATPFGAGGVKLITTEMPVA